MMGNKRAKTKLTEEKVLAIRQKRKNGATLTSLAVEFDIHFNTVRDICNRDTWKHI